MIIKKALVIQLLSHQYAKLVGYAVAGLCGIWIILNLIETSAVVFYRTPTNLSHRTQAAPSNAQATLLEQIPSWHLFGQTPITPANEKNIPLSSLNLTLNGIFYQKDKKQSQALITDANGGSKLYKIGDLVPGGVTLYDILPDSVIVESDGQLEKLSLSGRELEFAPPPQGLP